MTPALRIPNSEFQIPSTAPAGDAITAEIVRSTLVAITDEMKTNLMRTAYNQIIYEALDFTVGLFDADGNTLSIGLGLPMFIRGLSDAIKAKLAHYGRDGIEPGDILLTNDSYIMGSHLNHMIFSLPIFWEGRLTAFASSMAHWQDVGGVLRGTTRDIYSEGLQLPIVKIFKRGMQDHELTDIIRTNVRFPELAMGDFRAQVASIKTGERRVTDVLRRYGAETFESSIRRIYAQSESLARAAVRDIPDGTYEAESFMDDDGISIGRTIPVRVKVTVEGEQMTIDLSEVSPQVAGYFNSGRTAGRSAAQVAFKCLTTPLHLPINDGSFGPLDIVLPPGRVVSATKPAPTRYWMTIPMTIVDTIIRAMAPAIPRRVMAGHYCDLVPAASIGLDPRTGRIFWGSVGYPGGGWGAKYDSDGMCGTVCINDGDTHNAPAESNEAKQPIVIEEYALRQDSGGAGLFRGGLGIRRKTRLLAQATLNSQIERTKCPPWGLFGGLEAIPNNISVEHADGSRFQPPNGKIEARQLSPGDVVACESGGGGGFGNPLERPPVAVLADVRLGYVSIEAARRDYGVTIVPGDPPDLDVEATERLRAQFQWANASQLSEHRHISARAD